MTKQTEELVHILSENFRAALEAKEIKLAERINANIEQLIHYVTGTGSLDND